MIEAAYVNNPPQMYKPVKRFIDILIAVKRFIDILIASIALVILSPILLPVILILSITGEKEVFYFQKRIGYLNKPFDIYKFATMLRNSPNMGTGEITLRNDPRVTSFGKFLRISKINELPQIINVLKGDMSIVGPRPLMKVSFDLYSDEVKEKIYLSKPGMTGIGSIVFRDEEKLVSESNDPQHVYRNIPPACLPKHYLSLQRQTGNLVFRKCFAAHRFQNYFFNRLVYFISKK